MKRIALLFTMLLLFAGALQAQTGVQDDFKLVGDGVWLDWTVGVDTFATTLTADTVVFTEASASDIYFVSTQYVGGVDAQDAPLEWTAKEDTLIVTRQASGESGSIYGYLRIGQ